MKLMRDENEDAANASISLYFAMFCSVLFCMLFLLLMMIQSAAIIPLDSALNERQLSWQNDAV